MKKKFRSKWFRVAVEGATTDGRQIERQWLTDAAETYSQNTYGARVWMEHFRSVLPDSPFRAYGDVVALKTEEVDIAGAKKLALFAQIEPTEDLVAMNKARQKIYTSIEIRPKFADTGRAYLDGLAVTDTPASLGTEMLTFSAQNPDSSPLKARKRDPENLFTEAVETDLEFEEISDNAGAFKELTTRVKALFSKTQSQDGNFAELGEAITGLVEHAEQQQADVDAFKTEQAAMATKFSGLETRVQELIDKLGKTADHTQEQRPQATGGGADRIQTDC